MTRKSAEVRPNLVNTLTAGFQASSAGRTGPDRVVVFYATDHDDAAPEAERLINDAGFDPVRTGTPALTTWLAHPRRILGPDRAADKEPASHGTLPGAQQHQCPRPRCTAPAQDRLTRAAFPPQRAYA